MYAAAGGLSAGCGVVLHFLHALEHDLRLRYPPPETGGCSRARNSGPGTWTRVFIRVPDSFSSRSSVSPSRPNERESSFVALCQSAWIGRSHVLTRMAHPRRSPAHPDAWEGSFQSALDSDFGRSSEEECPRVVPARVAFGTVASVRALS